MTDGANGVNGGIGSDVEIRMIGEFCDREIRADGGIGVMGYEGDGGIWLIEELGVMG